MPSAATAAQSRALRGNVAPSRTAIANVSAPAKAKRTHKNHIGDESSTPILLGTYAEAQSRMYSSAPATPSSSLREAGLRGRPAFWASALIG